MAGGGVPSECPNQALRAWLEYVAETAIQMLDELDAQEADLEPDADDENGTEDDGVVVPFRAPCPFRGRFRGANAVRTDGDHG